MYDPDAWYSGSGSDFEIICGGTIGAVMGGLSSPSAGLAQMKSKLSTLGQDPAADVTATFPLFTDLRRPL